LASGGFGDTYLAKDPNLPQNQQCVVKFLKPNIEGLEESEAQERLRREAVTLQLLDTHPQIPNLLAYYAESFCLVIVTRRHNYQEYIEGESFHKEIYKLKGKEDSVREMLLDILHILGFVHDKGTIHRDIKPDNLIRRKSDGKFVLIDFGAVKQELTNIITSTQTSSPGQTVALQTIAIGTPGYMPLEQKAGRPQYNSDIYALGIIALQALTGILPDMLQERLARDSVQKICKQEKVSCSPRLAKILQKMVDSSYRERYQSAKAVLQDLEGIKTLNIKLLGWGVAAIAFISVILISIPYIRLILLDSKAQGFLDREEYEKAIDIYDQMLQIRPKLAYPWFKRGYPLGKLKRSEDKLKSCERAIALQTGFIVEALNCKALALSDLGQYEEAIKVYDEALTIEPEAVYLLNNKGEALLEKGDKDAALAIVEEAIRINSNQGNDDYAIDERRNSQYLKGNILFKM